MQRFGLLIGLLILVNIAALATDLNVVVINRHHMVSLSSFADKFGAVVDYDSERDGISLKLGDRTVDLIPYNRTAWVNGAAVSLDQPVVIVDDVTYLPLRFMCETLGLGYTCNDADSQVVVVDGYTNETCYMVIDWGWCNYPHFWCYDFDCRLYHGWCHDHNVIIALHHGGIGGMHPGGGYHQGGYVGHNAGVDAWHQHFANQSSHGAAYQGNTLHQGNAQHAPWFQSKTSQHASWGNHSTSSRFSSHSSWRTSEWKLPRRLWRL